MTTLSRIAWLAAWALAAGGTPAMAQPIAAANFGPSRPAPELDAAFQRSEGWIGGDGAYSAALDPQRTVWLFSDTWVGKVQGGRRTDATIVNNTLAVQHGLGSAAKWEFHIARQPDGAAKAWATPPDGRGWQWLHAGILADGKLRLFLMQIEKRPMADAADVFGFRPCGQWLGTVENPQAEPGAWRLRQAKVPFCEFTAERSRNYGAALLAEDGFVTIYGYDETPAPVLPRRRLVAARAPDAELDRFEAWRFRTADGWSADPRAAAGLADGLACEFSVHRLDAAGPYVLLHTENGLSPRVLARTAPQPWGPWSAPATVHVCAEGDWGPKVFCYAAKAHPGLSRPGELVFSYVANSFDFWEVARDARLYWPRFVRVKWSLPAP